MKKFFKFFKNFKYYFWIGNVLLLISLFLTVYVVEKTIWWQVGIMFIQTLGVSMIVASLFSFVVDSMSFQEKLKDLVEAIVLKRDFLRDLPIDRKKEALHYLIKPSSNEIEKYSNIADFYNYYIDEVMNVSKKNIRSNYNINLKVKIDETEKRVYSDGIYSYRLYPSEKGYTDLTIGFLKEDNKSTVEIILNFPDGKRKKFDFDEIKDYFHEDETSKRAKIEINDLCKKHKHVDIELRVKEYGYNHWMNVFFKAEQATDGFKMSVFCEKDLKVKNFLLFDVGHNYHVDLNEERNEFHISCHQWIGEGAGVSLIVSRPECQNENG